MSTEGLKGYAGKLLEVDLSTGRMVDIPTSQYADRFIGGRGVAAKRYWDNVPPEVKALDPKNELIFVTGPLGGFPGVSGSRWEVCGKSPITSPEHFSHANLGGSWGSHLKFAGYDGVIVRGSSEKPVYLFIQDGTAEVRDGSAFRGMGAVKVREILKGELGSSVRVTACGPAGDNRVAMASILADEDASGASGFGAVMGSKGLKAIAVRGDHKVVAAHPERLRQLTEHLRALDKGRMVPRRNVGIIASATSRRQVCHGCSSSGCWRVTMEATDGTRGKVMCASGNFYQEPAFKYYGTYSEVPFHANRLCDDYGLDTIAVSIAISWLDKCYQAGILTEKSTGLPLSKIGSWEFIQALVRKMAFREGFGEVLSQGTAHAAAQMGGGSEAFIVGRPVKAEEGLGGDPRMWLPVGICHAMEARQDKSMYAQVIQPLERWMDWVFGLKDAYVTSEVWRTIARKFLGSEIAADFSTYEGKALAAKRVQDRQFANNSLVACFYFWPIMDVKDSADHIGDPSLESQVYSAVTGKEADEAELCRMGEAIFNLNRAIRVREGHPGRKGDVLPEDLYTKPIESFTRNPRCLAPGKDGEVTSLKGAVVDRQKFERMKDEYYHLRGWDVASGLQTRATLEELGLSEAAGELLQKGLIPG